MKKWHTVLWVVLASMVLSSLGIVFFRQKHWTEVRVATINGKPVYFDTYRRSLMDMQERINALRGLAHAYGMSEEVFLGTFFGVSKPEELALDACINEVLLDQIKDEFNIIIDHSWFKQELLQSLPQLVDQAGHFNMDAYQRYLQQLSITPKEYEKRKAEEFKRNTIQNFVINSSYVPNFVAQDFFLKDMVEKSFILVKFPHSYFVAQAKKENVSENDLEIFFNEHKESYRISEKRKAKYWQFSPDQYVREVEVDPATVRSFYEKHKGTLFRIPPKIKVRHILFAHKDHGLAKKVYQELTSQPDKFESFAKEYSQDKKTAHTGGLVDFFSKGTYDHEFERAALRLHNVGEMSKLIKTKDGYEIIQLVQRIQAAEKPFDQVKEDITKTLKTKKSLSVLRSDLDLLMRNVRENAKALDQFVQSQNLKSKETDWLNEDDMKGKELTSLLAKRLFASDKRQSSVGYFMYEKDYVIYINTGIEKSYIPPLQEVKSTVLENFYNNKSEVLAKSMLKEIRALILDKKITLQQVADKYDVELIKTAKVKKNDHIKELGKDDESMRERLFTLTDPTEIVQVNQKDDYYLAQLSSIVPFDTESFAKNRQKIIKQEKFKEGSTQMGAFIASLHRNAKIEVDHKVLEGAIDVKD